MHFQIDFLPQILLVRPIHILCSFQEWKERKRLQKRVIAAKKKLIELEQQHVFDGFRYGEKSQARLLAEQIVAVNPKLLQQVLQKHTVRSISYSMFNSLFCKFLIENVVLTWYVI